MEKTEGQMNGEQHINYVENDSWSGITKREYMATHILAGISANRWSMEHGHYSHENLAKMAVEQADALLEELTK
jgi:hypothetical protein